VPPQHLGEVQARGALDARVGDRHARLHGALGEGDRLFDPTEAGQDVGEVLQDVSLGRAQPHPTRLLEGRRQLDLGRAVVTELGVGVAEVRPLARHAAGIAGLLVPDASTTEALARRADIENIIGRISPSTLFNESVGILLNPAARVFGMALQSQAEGILPTPLALDQSLTLIWPHITTIFGLVAVCFGISYIIFMRAEIRA